VAFLKLVAGMLGVGLDELVQRETTRRQRRLALLAAASLGGMAVTSTLAVTAIQARDAAREQRREAEGLIGFMLGDLKDKLEPIGRLDALDGVGARVLDYYKKEGTSDLSDASLLQRSRALSLMAEVATKRGDVDGALRLYSEAMAGTREAIARKPEDPQRLFDHAQNVFYIGAIAQERGDTKTSERYFREYKRLAARMVAIAPDNMKWRMEVQYADADLGSVLYRQRRFAEAAAQFQEALSTIEAISTADPSNQDYRKSVAESLAWLADARRATGQYDAAIALRQRDVALLDALYAKTGDVDYRQRLIPARRALGNLYDERGQAAAAIEQYRAAIAHADALRAIEPDNAQWSEYGYQVRKDLASALLGQKQVDEAAAQTNLLCETVRRLLARDAANPMLRRGSVSCAMMKARLALLNGSRTEASTLADQAIATAKSTHTDDKVIDGFLLAAAYRLRGDVERQAGDAAAARGFWMSGIAAIPPGAAEQPYETAERWKILTRLGRTQEAAPLAARLRSIGYKAADE
jgi:tetratricopeptide (TPR) repeat protein